MKFTSILLTTLASSLVAASPLPKVKTAYVTQYTTVKVTLGSVTTLITPTAAPTTTTEDADAAKVTGDVKAAAQPDAKKHDDNKDDKTTTTSTLASPSSTSSSEEGLGETFTGDGTYYDPLVALGSCGDHHTEDDMIVAISIERQNEVKNAHKQLNNNKNPVCGAKIKVTNPENGNTAIVTVVDTCASCKRDDLDLTPKAYNQLTNNDVSAGRIKINWQWVDKDF